MGLAFWRKPTPHEILKEEFMDPASQTHKRFEEIIRNFSIIEPIIKNEEEMIKSFRDKIGYNESDKQRLLSNFNNIQREANDIRKKRILITGFIEILRTFRDKLQGEYDYIHSKNDNEYPSNRMNILLKEIKRVRNNINTLSKHLRSKEDMQIFVFVDAHEFNPNNEAIQTHEIAEFVDRLYNGTKIFEKSEKEIEHHLKGIIKERLKDAIKKCNNAGIKIVKYSKDEIPLKDAENELIDFLMLMDQLIVDIRKESSNDMITKLEIFIQKSKESLERAKRKEELFINSLETVKRHLNS